MGLPRTMVGKDSIMAVGDRFSKIADFILCHRIDDAIFIANPFMKEFIKLYGVPHNFD